jgi:hypothetical protein
VHFAIIRDMPRADAMLGALEIGSQKLYTLEPPWVPIDGALCGHPGQSCVPAGDYMLVRHNTTEHPKTFALVAPSLGVYNAQADIPPGCIGRFEVLLHNGNYPRNSLGCILLGLGRSVMNGPMVTNSDDALRAFQALVPWMDGHTLSIIAAPAAAPGDTA